ncbi:MAG: hypothetical protein IPL75_13145 [Acidobacteria bacterium]|nr:hypothetical protein [Acidobacteriota bacterium]
MSRWAVPGMHHRASSSQARSGSIRWGLGHQLKLKASGPQSRGCLSGAHDDRNNIRSAANPVRHQHF